MVDSSTTGSPVACRNVGSFSTVSSRPGRSRNLGRVCSKKSTAAGPARVLDGTSRRPAGPVTVSCSASAGVQASAARAARSDSASRTSPSVGEGHSGRSVMSVAEPVLPVPGQAHPVAGQPGDGQAQCRPLSSGNRHRTVARHQGHPAGQPGQEIPQEQFFVRCRNLDRTVQQQVPQFLGQPLPGRNQGQAAVIQVVTAGLLVDPPTRSGGGGSTVGPQRESVQR